MKLVLKDVSFLGILIIIGCAIFIAKARDKEISGKVSVTSYEILR